MIHPTALRSATVYAVSLFVLAMASTGCDWPSPNSNQAAGQYEFARDERGRLIRLNKSTGELTVVNSTTATAPAAPKVRDAPSGLSRQLPGPPRTGNVTDVQNDGPRPDSADLPTATVISA